MKNNNPDYQCGFENDSVEAILANAGSLMNDDLCFFDKVFKKGTNKKQIVDIINGIQENERKIIGRELHDNVNQILTTVKLFMGMLSPVTGKDKKIRDKSVSYVIMAIDEIRKIAGDLVLPENNEQRLVDQICQVIEDIHFSTTIRVSFSYCPAIECLSRDKKTTLFRIIQEQFKNIINYSKAEKVKLVIEIKNGKVLMEIKDNGQGFDPRKISMGTGLSNIYERITFFKGSFDIKTAAGKGCELFVCLPAA